MTPEERADLVKDAEGNFTFWLYLAEQIREAELEAYNRGLEAAIARIESDTPWAHEAAKAIRELKG